MTDPLSISAGVAGLLSLAAAVSRSCYGTYREIKDAPGSLKDVVNELNLLCQVLTDLLNICDQSSEPLAPLENVVDDIRDCEKKLEDFHSKLDTKYYNPRSFLSRIRWSFGGSEVKVFVEQLQKYRGMFESAKTNATLKLAMAIRSDVKKESLLLDITRKRVVLSLAETKLRSIIQWLSPLEFSTTQNDFHDFRREPRTSEWIKHDPTFVEWRDRAVLYSTDPKRTLWCHGNPGSGKSIACSVLINNLLQSTGDNAVAYLYCSGQDQGAQSPEALIGSIIKQIISRKILEAQVPTVVEDLYDKFELGGKPSIPILVKTLKGVTELFARVFLVVDGIDELEKEVSGALLLGALQLIPKNKTKFLISTRTSFTGFGKYLDGGFKIEIRAQQEDISLYLANQIGRNENLQMLVGDDPTFIRNMISEISQQCQGQLSEETSKAAVATHLKHPTESLRQEYHKGLDRMKLLPSPHYKVALKTMNYMASSKVLLTAEELLDALSVERGYLMLDSERRPPLALVLTVCLGFVTANPISGKMEFFHITVSEFLTTSDIWDDLELDFGGCCVTYLMSANFKRPCSHDEEARERRSQHPFAAYASRFWGDNIRGASENKYSRILCEFLCSDNRISSLQLLPPHALYDPRLIGERNDWYQVIEDSNSFAIYTCAYLRLKDTMLILLGKDFDQDYTSPFGQRFSPLHIAVDLQDLEMCQWLIQAGVNVNVRDATGQTPLHLCWGQHGIAVAQISGLLEDAGARFDACDSSSQTVLHKAVQYNHPYWIQHILQKLRIVDINKQDVDGNSALHFATLRGYETVVRIMLQQNASPTLNNSAGQSPLTLAMQNDSSSSVYIVEEIIARDDHADNKHELLPTERAAAETHLAEHAQRIRTKMVTSTRSRGSDYTLAVQEGPPSFIRIIQQGDPYDLSVALLNGVKFNNFDTASGMTPLHHAVLNGHVRSTWHLLAAGARKNVKDKKHGLTPLEMARREGHADVAALFEPIIGDWVRNGFVWQHKSYQVGRGFWSKLLSGTELEGVYQNARTSSLRPEISSIVRGRDPRFYYEYLGIEEGRMMWAGYG